MSSRQNPLHLSSWLLLVIAFWRGHIAFQCFVSLSLSGGHIALLQCFVHIYDKKTAILKWSSTILTVTHLIAYSIMKYHDISYISP